MRPLFPHHFTDSTPFKFQPPHPHPSRHLHNNSRYPRSYLRFSNNNSLARHVTLPLPSILSKHIFFLLMAHRTEKEETEFKVVPSDTITLCVNCGGVAGNSATNSMCQKCFSASATSAGGANPVKHAFGEKNARSARRSPERSLETSSDLKDETESSPPAKRVVNRCSGCRRKVGLTGFRCRCGELFCADHRYSDRHECSYDYKTAGREAIARENPVVKAAKIVKI